MRIFVTGQTTVHWGRKEYGNIGNYYVTESFFNELNRVFPKAEIVTTLQLSDKFCEKHKITCTDISLYYNWSDNDLSNTLREYSLAYIYSQTNQLVDKTPFIEEVLRSDLVIDHSGDMWGENADLAGKNRFLIGLLKDRIVQLLKKKIVMLGGSPGPFNEKWLPLVRDVVDGFNLITTRELASKKILSSYGINTSHVLEYACPAFLFEGVKRKDVEKYLINTPLRYSSKPKIGFILCGWNMLEGPYSKWPRSNSEYELFAELIEYIIKQYNSDVCLLSHSNGFTLDSEFKLIHGRDFDIQKQLYNILVERGNVSKNIYLFDEIYSPEETKTIIAEFDLLVSGRIHGAIAGLSEKVPTVIIDYGHEPKAHKIKGFAKLAGVEEYVADPADVNQMKRIFSKCWNDKDAIRKHLDIIIPEIQERARENFDNLKNIVESD